MNKKTKNILLITGIIVGVGLTGVIIYQLIRPRDPEGNKADISGYRPKL